MNKKNPIDDLFQSKLEDSGLPYNPNYWAGAESIIASAKKPAAKNRKLVYLIALLLLISTTLLTLLLKPDSHSIEIKKKTAANHVEQTVGTTIDQNPTNKLSELVAVRQNETNTQSITENTLDLTKQTAPKYQTKPNDSFISAEKSSPGARKRAAITESHATSAPIYQPFTPLDVQPRWSLQFNFQEFIIANPFLKFEEQTFIHTALSKWSWFLSPQFTFGNFQITGDKPSFEGLNWKEEPKFSSAFGLTILAKRGHWGFKTGFMNQTISQTVDYTSSTEQWSYDTSATYSIHGYTNTSRGTKVAYLRKDIDSTKSIVEDRICDNCPVEFNYISIPLMLQYEWTQKRNIFFIESGISYHMLQKSSGVYLVENSEQPKGFEIVDLSQTDYLNSSILWMHLNIGAKYRLNSKLNAFGSVGLSESTNSLLRTGTQKANTKNIHVGIEYRLK